MDLISHYLDYMAPMRGSTNFHRWAILSVISALLERRVWLDRGRLGIIFPNTYTLFVGGPACGKSWAAEQATRFIQHVKIPGRKSPYCGATKITQAALYKDLQDSERAYSIAGFGALKQSPLFIYASELAVNMSDFGGGTLTNELIDFYDSKSLSFTMVKRTIKDSLITLTNPSITFLGCTTEEYLQSASQDKLITSGLSSRIVYVVEPERVKKQRRNVDQDQTLFDAIVSKLTDIFKLQGPMRFAPDAFELYITLAEAADEKCFNSINAFEQNYFGRKPDHLTKVAMLFAATRGKLIVTVNDLEQARVWIEELEPNMDKALGMRNIEKSDEVGALLLKHISKSGTSKKDLLCALRSGGKFMPLNGVFDANIKGLKEMGQVREDTIGNETLYTRLY